jgi:hypothetical protein
MKNRLKSFGIIVLVTIIGFTFAACEDQDLETDQLPALTGTVTITGDAQVGQTLTANTTNLSGSGIITFQWKRDATTVIGDNSSTYMVQDVDLDSVITVTVVRSGNSGSVTSAPTTKVTELTSPVLDGVFVITESSFGAYAGYQLTAIWTGDTGVTYQWSDANGPISGATNITYTPTEVGTFTVTVSLEGFIPVSRSITITNAPWANFFGLWKYVRAGTPTFTEVITISNTQYSLIDLDDATERLHFAITEWVPIPTASLPAGLPTGFTVGYRLNGVTTDFGLPQIYATHLSVFLNADGSVLVRTISNSDIVQSRNYTRQY